MVGNTEMTSPPNFLADGLMGAGREYTSKLSEFGLPITFSGWVFPENDGRYHLAIVTKLIEMVGPLAIYDLLFKAYDASVLPREIDPFLVSVYGPNSAFGTSIRTFLPKAMDLSSYAERPLFKTRGDDPVWIVPRYIIRADPSLKLDTPSSNRAWRKFVRNMNSQLAA